MEIAILADVHGNATALQCVIDDLTKRKINQMILLGDIIMKGPLPNESLKLLTDSNFHILAWIKGNTENWLNEIDKDWEPQTKRERELFLYYRYATKQLSEEQIEMLKKLPKEQVLYIHNHPILCVHGTPKSDMEAFDDGISMDKIKAALEGVTQEIILGGHSHTPFFMKLDEKYIFNPGSIGLSKEESKHISYGIMEIDEEQVAFHHVNLSYNKDELLQAAIENQFPLFDLYQKQIL